MIKHNLYCVASLLLVSLPFGCSSTGVGTEVDPASASVPRNAAVARSSAPDKATLYQRLGGYEAISAVVDKFADRLFADPVVGKRFFGMSADSRASFKQKNTNLVCNVTGGPCKIISRTAKDTHGGLGIKASEFDIVVGHLVAVLDEFKVPAEEKKELLDIIGSLRPDIVELEGK